MKPTPIITLPEGRTADAMNRITAEGTSFCIYEWKGSGPGYLHIHHEDDEAWHILDGIVRFRFLDKQIDAPAGATIFVPAGVAHDYQAMQGARYLIILTPRLKALIDELHTVPLSRHAEVMQKYKSEIVEQERKMPRE